MKKAILIVLIGMMFGCSYVDHYYPKNELIGSWVFQDESKGGLILTFNKDWTYVLDYGQENLDQITGVYSIYNNRVQFRDDHPRENTDCYEAGFYLYQRDGDTIHFDEFADQCLPRKYVLALPMKKVNLKPSNVERNRPRFLKI